MEIYIFLAIVVLSFLVYLFDNIIIDKIWWMLVFFLLVYFLSNQGLLSPDRYRYIEYYVDTGMGIHEFVYEKGFMILNKYMYQVLGMQFNYVFDVYYIIMAGFFTLGFNYLARMKREYMLVIPLFFANTILPASIIIRQFTAIGVCLFSINLFFKKRYVLFVILIIFTTFLHATAPAYLVACLLFIFITHNFKLRYKVILTAFLGIGAFFGLKINYISRKIAAYTTANNIVDRNKFGLVMILFFITLMLYILYILFRKIKFKTEYEKFNLFMGILFFVIYIAFFNYGFMSRIAYYFQVFMYAALIDFIDLIKNKLVKIIFLLIYLLVALFIGLRIY